MQKTVTLTFCLNLDCGECNKLIIHFQNPLKTVDGLGMIVANITATEHVGSEWKYTITYDDVLLTVPEDGFAPCDIKSVCCYGCVAEYSDKILSTAHWTLEGDLGPAQRIDIYDPSDTVQIKGVGLIQTTAGATDRLDIALTAGDEGEVLTTLAGGIIDWRPQTTCEDIQDCIGTAVGSSTGITYDDVGNTFSVAVNSNGGISLTPTGLAVNVADTNSVDMNISGNTITSNVKRHAGGQISEYPDGIGITPSVADGDILTTVSGEPVWQAPVSSPSDSVALLPGANPAGGQTFRHTSVDGVDVDICNGFCEIDVADACLGVGSSNMIRQISLNGSTLVVRSAPEHTSQAVSATVISASVDVNPGDNYDADELTVLVAGHPCRETAVYFIRQAEFNLMNIFPTDGVERWANWRGTFQTTGLGGFPMGWMDYKPASVTNNDFARMVSQPLVAIIPAGGTFSFTVSPRVEFIRALGVGTYINVGETVARGSYISVTR